MYLNRSNQEQLFIRYANSKNQLSLEGFKMLCNEVLDKSYFLEKSDYISLPEIRNILNTPAFISFLIEEHKNNEISDLVLIEKLHKNLELFQSSIKKLARRD